MEVTYTIITSINFLQINSYKTSLYFAKYYNRLRAYSSVLILNSLILAVSNPSVIPCGHHCIQRNVTNKKA